ncbi:MAG: hypothetical protein ACK4E3_08775 [Brevundimonas sp.]|jgi:hypothetical protein|uniref:hypothetical protein n=1 Tax=Brevundimonas sp. TaxID=1871086 RepID=UPI00391DA228
MFLALVMTAAMAGQSTGPGVVDRLQQFCLATEMREAAFVRVAQEQGMERLIRVVRSVDDIDHSEWDSMFRGGGLSVGMTGRAGEDVATYCAVMLPVPAEDWRGDGARLAEAMGLVPADAETPDDVLEMHMWSDPEGEQPSLVYMLYRSSLVVSLERRANP